MDPRVRAFWVHFQKLILVASSLYLGHQKIAGVAVLQTCLSRLILVEKK